MNPKLEQTLIDLANRLGTTVDSIHTTMLCQSDVYAYFSVFLFSLFLFANLLLSCLSFYMNKKRHENNTEGFYICIFFTSISYLFSFVFFIENAYKTFTAFYNPEYWVLLKISEMFVGN